MKYEAKAHHVQEGFTSIRIVPPSINVCLEMLTILQLRLVLLLQILRSVSLGSVELGEVAFVVVESLRVLMDDIGCDSIEECSVVRTGLGISDAACRKQLVVSLTQRAGYLARSAYSPLTTQWHSNPTYWKAHPA